MQDDVKSKKSLTSTRIKKKPVRDKVNFTSIGTMCCKICNKHFYLHNYEVQE